MLSAWRCEFLASISNICRRSSISCNCCRTPEVPPPPPSSDVRGNAVALDALLEASFAAAIACCCAIPDALTIIGDPGENPDDPEGSAGLPTAELHVAELQRWRKSPPSMERRRVREASTLEMEVRRPAGFELEAPDDKLVRLPAGLLPGPLSGQACSYTGFLPLFMDSNAGTFGFFSPEKGERNGASTSS